MSARRLIRSFLLISGFFIIAFSGHGTIIHIPADYPTIQDASDFASEGDTLLLAHGLYQESVTLRGHGIVLASHYILDRDSNHIGNTVLIPELDLRTISMDSSVASEITIMGLSFTNGDFFTNEGGSALYAFGISLDVISCRFYSNEGNFGTLVADYCVINLQDNTFTGNYSFALGGAMAINYSSFHIEGNRFLSNYADYAGAISTSRSSGVIRFNEFIDNASNFNGGALTMTSEEDGNIDNIVISNNTFQNNVSAFGGAIATLNMETLVISSNLFIGNSAEHVVWTPFGGAIWLGPGSSEVDIYDNEFCYNKSSSDGSAVTFSSDAQFHDNLLFRNTGTSHYVLSTQNSNNNHGMHAHVYNNLFFRNTKPNHIIEHDYGCIGAKLNHLMTAYSNDFYGSFTYAAGVHAIYPGVLNVENNYWGHDSGPYHRIQNPDGLGDPVMEEVNILPFATHPFTTRWLRAPEPLALISPEADEFLSEDTVQFLWHAAADSTPHDTLRYTLELADNPEFLDALLIDTDLNTFVTVPNLNWESDYYWRVAARDIYDLVTYSEETRAFMVTLVDENEFDGLPTEWAIESIYPNPFNRMVQVVIGVPNRDDVRIAIYDLQGRLVDTLQQGSLTPGHHRFVWRPDGATGMYFVRVSAGSWQGMRKVVYLK
jgi:Secretion system C-terminal sorting domain